MSKVVTVNLNVFVELELADDEDTDTVVDDLQEAVVDMIAYDLHPKDLEVLVNDVDVEHA